MVRPLDFFCDACRFGQRFDHNSCTSLALPTWWHISGANQRLPTLSKKKTGLNGKLKKTSHCHAGKLLTCGLPSFQDLFKKPIWVNLTRHCFSICGVFLSTGCASTLMKPFHLLEHFICGPIGLISSIPPCPGHCKMSIVTITHAASAPYSDGFWRYIVEA